MGTYVVGEVREDCPVIVTVKLKSKGRSDGTTCAKALWWEELDQKPKGKELDQKLKGKELDQKPKGKELDQRQM